MLTSISSQLCIWYDVGRNRSVWSCATVHYVRASQQVRHADDASCIWRCLRLASDTPAMVYSTKAATGSDVPASRLGREFLAILHLLDPADVQHCSGAGIFYSEHLVSNLFQRDLLIAADQPQLANLREKSRHDRTTGYSHAGSGKHGSGLWCYECRRSQ